MYLAYIRDKQTVEALSRWLENARRFGQPCKLNQLATSPAENYKNFCYQRSHNPNYQSDTNTQTAWESFTVTFNQQYGIAINLSALPVRKIYTVPVGYIQSIAEIASKTNNAISSISFNVIFEYFTHKQTKGLLTVITIENDPIRYGYFIGYQTTVLHELIDIVIPKPKLRNIGQYSTTSDLITRLLRAFKTYNLIETRISELYGSSQNYSKPANRRFTYENNPNRLLHLIGLG